MRISSLAILLLLAACGKRDETPTGTAASGTASPTPTASPGPAPVADDDDHVACAHGGAPLAADCSVERTETDAGLVLTIRHPDGAFRRLVVTQDGRGVAAADGAQPARVTVVGSDAIDVAIGGDRYRLPATVGKTG